MDKTPSTGNSLRRSQKRPHSPPDEGSTTNSSKVPSGSKPILESEAKQDKLLRLLGGKKRKNEAAASKWLERVRSREDEIKLSTDLESQYNESLTNKLTGHVYRHVGIGFHDDPGPSPPSQDSSSAPTKTDMPKTTEKLESKDNKVKNSAIDPPVTNSSTTEPKSRHSHHSAETYKPYARPDYHHHERNRLPPPFERANDDKIHHREHRETPPVTQSDPHPVTKSKTAFYAQFKKAS